KLIKASAAEDGPVAAHDEVHLRLAHPIDEQQAQARARPTTGLRMGVAVARHVRQARLPVARHWIVQAGLDVRLLQMRAQRVALRRAHDEQVPDVILMMYGRHAERQAGEAVLVAPGERLAARGPRVEALELVPQD